MQPNIRFSGILWLREKASKQITFVVWRGEGVIRLAWNRELLANVTVGILEVASGPREWSPRRAIPDDFTPMFEVHPDDRLSIVCDRGNEYLKDWWIRSEGHVGFFPADSKSLADIRSPWDLVFGVSAAD